MSDHAWVQEQIAAAVAGGLTGPEAERLDAHVRDCPECAAALADARTLDRGLGSLFAPVRPGPELEDEVIHGLRAARARRLLLSGWKRTLAVGVAASVGLGITGAMVSQLAELGRLPFPGAVSTGEARAKATNFLKQLGLALSPPPNAELARVPDGGSSTLLWAERTGGEGDENVNGVRSDKNVPDHRSYVGPADSPPAARHPPAAEGSYRGDSDGDAKALKDQIKSFDTAALSTYYSTVNTRSEPVSTDSKGKDGGNWNYSFGYTKPSDYKAELPKKDGGPAEPKAKGEGKSVAPEAVTEETTSRFAAGILPAAGQAPPPAENPPPAPQRKVIRSGDVEFEVESFDSAVATVTKLVTGINGAFVATVNSEKLPNGKVRGAMVVRVPPEHLDSLVLDLRKELGKAGELKGQRIGSQDITKQYTDLESRLKAARTMEQRLLQIIKEGKGEIKQLLEAEKELGVWRTRIEEFEGELRYYGNLVSLSTLTVKMAEREIKAAAGLTECERVQAGVEVEDVDAARQQALAAVAEAKGRVMKSELKQLAAGQFNATLHFEVPPDAAGPLRDRLRQIGRVVRLEIDRVQQAEPHGASVTLAPVPRDTKVTRGDAQFLVQIYNLANVAPRETVAVQVAVADVPAGYQAVRAAVGKASGRVLAARLDEQDRQNVTAQLDFEVRRADEPGLQAALAAAGEVVARQVTRAPEGDNVTDAKVLFRATLLSAARLKPRETTTLAVEVRDVDAAVAVFAAQVAEAKGRPVDVQVAHERAGQVTARLIYDVPLAAAPAVVAQFKAAGTVRVHRSTRDPQAPDGRYATARLEVTLSNTDLIVAKDDGLWPQVRRGLSYSASVLLMSVTWVVFGLCVVLPWAVVGYAGYRLVRRLARPSPTATTV
jgi:Domain of unknown function (DUF4349)/Putative zinc-finger